MYFLNQNHTGIMKTESDYCTITIKDYNKIIYPYFYRDDDDENCILLGTYANEEEAKAVLEDIFNAFALEHNSYVMPPSRQAVVESPVTEEKNVEVSEEPVVEEPKKKRKYTRRKKGE